MKQVSCPVHGVRLSPKDTRHGKRFGCWVAGCDVICWDSKTSTPADKRTREARMACHEAFDRLWRDGRIFKKRSEAYSWMAKAMGVNKKLAHIGMFNFEQCERLLECVRLLVEDGK